MNTEMGGPAPKQTSEDTKHASGSLSTGKSNPLLNEAVSLIRRGIPEFVTTDRTDRIEAGRSLLASRLSTDEIASTEAFQRAVNRNSDNASSYYTMALINDPSNAAKPISIACGSLTTNGTLIIGYAATSEEFANKGLGRAVVNNLIANANRESNKRHGTDIKMIALEASNISPSFWEKKIGCSSINIVLQNGEVVPFRYIQPTFDWDYETGMPIGDGLNSSMQIKLNGKDFQFPGVEEKFMVKVIGDAPITIASIMNSVTDFLDNYYFNSEREEFLSDNAYQNYMACRTGLLEAYQNQFVNADRISQS